MKIAYVYDALNKKNIHIPSKSSLPAELIEYAMWSSETHPFDPMEIAIHELYQQTAKSDKRLLATQEHEYPLSGQPPMMTHIFKLSDGSTIIASKGAPEAIFRHCDVSRHDYELLNSETLKYAAQGFRVLAVAKAKSNGAYPSSQQDFQLNILGLIAFYDPPKKNITSILRAFYEAGISVKIITGDYSQTVLAIAKAINLKNSGLFLTGDDIAAMPEDVLRQKVKEINIYARMYPESKLKVINALKANGEVVAMTGDGVNDALALKAAHIGIAMGRRGNEVAKNASSLILTDDDLAHMVQAIGLGRKIYDNLKKAIQYIISIHIPIILIVTLPLLLSWKFSGIFTPMHVIFFELIMGPTCSVIYENEPQEPDAMYRPPRKPSYTFFSSRQLMISILQGVVITVGCLGIGLYFMNRGCTETMVRASIFITLIFCNILLTFENRSFHHSVFKTWAYKNDLLYAITGLTALLVPLLLIVPFFRKSFQLTHLSVSALATCFTVAIASTLWIELLKYFKRGKRDA